MEYYNTRRGALVRKMKEPEMADWHVTIYGKGYALMDEEEFREYKEKQKQERQAGRK